MNPRWGVGRAAVCARAVHAGIIASSKGRPTAMPAPRRNVRRERCFLVMNMSSKSPFTLSGRAEQRIPLLEQEGRLRHQENAAKPLLRRRRGGHFQTVFED